MGHWLAAFKLVGLLSIIQSEVVPFINQAEWFESWPMAWKLAEWFTSSPKGNESFTSFAEQTTCGLNA